MADVRDSVQPENLLVAHPCRPTCRSLGLAQPATQVLADGLLGAVSAQTIVLVSERRENAAFEFGSGFRGQPVAATAIIGPVPAVEPAPRLLPAYASGPLGTAHQCVRRTEDGGASPFARPLVERRCGHVEGSAPAEAWSWRSGMAGSAKRAELGRCGGSATGVQDACATIASRSLRRQAERRVMKTRGRLPRRARRRIVRREQARSAAAVCSSTTKGRSTRSVCRRSTPSPTGGGTGSSAGTCTPSSSPEAQSTTTQPDKRVPRGHSEGQIAARKAGRQDRRWRERPRRASSDRRPPARQRGAARVSGAGRWHGGRRWRGAAGPETVSGGQEASGAKGCTKGCTSPPGVHPAGEAARAKSLVRQENCGGAPRRI